MIDVVLDASAVLAMLRGESGADAVSDLLPGAALSAVNYAEIVAKLVDFGAPATEAVAALGELAMQVLPLDRVAGARVGALRETTRDLGLSLGDRACLALAQQLGVAAVTSDRAWAKVDVGVEVVLIR